MKIVYLCGRFPYPLERGDKLRIYHQIKYLSKVHDVYLFAINHHDVPAEHFAKVSEFCREIHVFKMNKFNVACNVLISLLKGLPLQTGVVYSAANKRKMMSHLAEIQPDHIICHFLRPVEYIKDYDCPKTLDYQDVLSKGFLRRAKAFGFPKNLLYWFEGRLLARYERKIFDYFDNKLIIAETDREFIPHKNKHEIKIIGNGIDTDFYKPIDCRKEYDICFVGNMSYDPNILACEYLVKEVLPKLKKTFPTIKVLLAGANPAPQVKALAGDGVEVSGWMDDIRMAYAKSRIFVGPLNIGTGVQNKILEAMAMKVPVVTSELCNSAIRAQNEHEILVCDNVQDYVQAIIDLLSDAKYSAKIAENAYSFIHKHFVWDKINAKLEEIIS